MLLIVLLLSLLTNSINCFIINSNNRLINSNKRNIINKLYNVNEVNSIDEFDNYINNNDIVVIDYSTTWCGPCKLVAPKFEELSKQYITDNDDNNNERTKGNSIVFLKCIGDLTADASALMKREGVRSVPTFHIWKNKEKVDVVNGARIDEVDTSIKLIL